jgi:hypothetical protein
VRTGNTERIAPPHDHQRTIGHFHVGDASHVQLAVDAPCRPVRPGRKCPGSTARPFS